MPHNESASIPPETLNRIMMIDGSVDAEECAHLYTQARKLREGCIVEIGAYHGRSTAALALGTLAGARLPLYTIEPHEHFVGVYGGKFGPADRGIFFQGMLELGIADTVRLIGLSSEYVTGSWPCPVGLLWIDGDHSYAGVRRDMDCWLPHLRGDAVIIFDDALDTRQGPYLVIEELVKEGGWKRSYSLGKTITLSPV